MTAATDTEISRQQVMIRRRPWRKWRLAAIGSVMILHGGGVVFGWYPTRWVLELIYPGRDIPGFETRDRIWAGAFLIVGALLIGMAAGRVTFRRPVIETSDTGIRLSVGSPLASPLPVRWENVKEIEAGVSEDEFGAYSALLLRIDDPEVIPETGLWRARWNDGVLAIPASGWQCRVDEAAEMLVEARRSSVAPGNGTGDESDEPESDEPESDQLDVRSAQAGEGGEGPEDGPAITAKPSQTGAPPDSERSDPYEERTPE